MKASVKILGLEKLSRALTGVDNAVKLALAEGLELSAIQVHETAVKSIQRSSGRYLPYQRGKKVHWSSPPGSPPNTDTGRLASSIHWDIDKSEPASYVGTNLAYGAYLEFGTKDVAARPWLLPALRANQDKIRRIMASRSIKRFLKG